MFGRSDRVDLRKFQKSLDVTCPYSMLRVHVVDFGNSNAVTRALAEAQRSAVAMANSMWTMVASEDTQPLKCDDLPGET